MKTTLRYDYIIQIKWIIFSISTFTKSYIPAFARLKLKTPSLCPSKNSVEVLLDDTITYIWVIGIYTLVNGCIISKKECFRL